MESIRKKIGLVLRIVISCGVLGYLASKLDWTEFFNIVKTAQPLWLLAGFVLMGGTMLLGTVRWKMLLRVQGIELPYGKLLEVTFIGTFFNAFLLGVTGGDVAKIYYTAQATPEKRSAASLSIIYDRVMGLLAVVLWGLILCLFFYPLLESTMASRKAVWSFMLIAVGAFGAIIGALLLPKIRERAELWKWEQKLPFHQTIENLSEAFQKYARATRINFNALALSLTIHFLIFLIMYCVALSLRLEIAFWALAAIVSIVNVLIAIPISISGLGVREGLFAMFLSLLSIGHEEAVAFSLLGFVLSLGWSMVGGLVHLRYKQPAASGAATAP